MANYEILPPYILFMECGLKKEHAGKPAAAIFGVAKARGYSNDPADKGGHTMCGVTLATYRQFRKGATVADLKALTYEDWAAIFKRLYWDRCKADEIADQSVANMLVDWVWGSGANGIKRTQRLLGVKDDGIVGPKTLAAINAADPKRLFERMKEDRHLFHEQAVKASVAAYAKKIGREPTAAEKLEHTNYRFRNGWRRRVNGIVYGGFDYGATW